MARPLPLQLLAWLAVPCRAARVFSSRPPPRPPLVTTRRLAGGLRPRPSSGPARGAPALRPRSRRPRRAAAGPEDGLVLKMDG